MKMINPDDIKLKRIINSIERGQEDGVSSKEILDDLQQTMPPKIIIKEKEPKSSPEQLEYLKNYRLMKKENLKIQNEKDLLQLKIQKAKERVSFFCYECKRSVIVDSKDNKHDIIKKPNRTHQSLIILNKCNECGRNIKAFGGKV